MKKGKAVLVTIVMTFMLIIIDISLFQLNRNGFIALTAGITIYGYFRCASDFCGWLSQDAENDDSARYLDRTSTEKKGRNTSAAHKGGWNRA